MADTNTTNLNLVKPEVGASSDTWGTKWNSNADAVDALFDAGPVLKVAKGGTGSSTASGARTNLGLGGLAVLSAVGSSEITDGSVGTAELASGAVTTAKIGDGQVTTAKIGDGQVTTAKIANLAVTTAEIGDGQVTTAKIADNAVTTAEIADGAVTAAKLAAGAIASSVPAGAVMPYAGATEPSGWLFCFGQAVSRTTYAALFTAIGTAYGAGDGSTTFALPDLRGRVVAGQDDMGGTSANRLTNQSGGVDGDVLGAAGGAETHTLTTAQMPAHTHSEFGASGSGSFNSGGSPGSSGTSSTTGSTGGGGAHNNVQPTIILNYIIKV